MKCPECEGLGYREYEHGLIRIGCRECKGTGEIPDGNDIDSRIGQSDSKPIKPRKRKRKTKTT